MKTLSSFISDRYTSLKASAYFSVLDRNLPVWLSILTGVFAFVGITGGRILRTGYTDWLMEEIDAGTNFLGWQFFRHTPIFQFPLGAIPSFGTDMGNTVVHTDSIILFAFLFKPFSSLLPHTFQFVGLWILCCFVLQAFFAYKLLAYFTQDKWLLWIEADSSYWRRLVYFGSLVIIAFSVNGYCSRDFVCTFPADLVCGDGSSYSASLRFFMATCSLW